MAAGTLVLAAAQVSAHYCGPPIIRCKPGDVVTYYILSDMAEVGDSFYSVFSQSDSSVAPLVYFTPVARVAGQFVFVAKQPGINSVSTYWSFPPTGAEDFCLTKIIVQPNAMTTAGAYFWSAYYGDPVNMFTGELVLREPADLNLGGPMALMFRRYYASRLQVNGAVNSRLGNNWSHNFDWRAVLVVTNRAIIISPEGLQVKFNQSGSDWVLESPSTYPFQLVNQGPDLVFGDPRDQHLYTFNTNGLLTAISDGKGNTHTLSYTDDFLLSAVSDGLGRSLTFTYTGPRFLHTVSDGTRTITFQQFEIGDDFNLFSVTDPLGNTTSYAYDNSKEIGSLLTSKTYPLGNVDYAQSYDDEGRVIQQTRFGTNLTFFSYDTNTLATTASNAQGRVSTFVHSPAGQFLSLTDPAGHKLSLSTNGQGRQNMITDRNGRTVGVAFDPASGKPSAQTNLDGAVTYFTYTNRTVMGIQFHELSTVTTPDGAREEFTYDGVGNLLTSTGREGEQTRMSYNSRGQLTGLTNPTGGVVAYTYHPDGTLATSTDAETGTSSYAYDGLRRLTNAIASDGTSVRASFDAADRLISLTDEQSHSTTYAYDKNNRLTGITNVFGQVTQFSYDDGNRQVAVTDALGHRTSFAYNLGNRPVAVTNRNLNTYLMGFDGQQRQRTVTDPAGKVWSIGVNLESVPSSFTDPLGNMVSHALDAAGFISATTNALGQVMHFNRDVMHRLTGTLNALGRLDRYDSDSRGFLTNTTFSAVGSATYAVNELGLITNLTDQAGSQWRFDYSPLGRLTRLVDPFDRTNSTTYDRRGRPQRLAYADGTAQTNSYDDSGNLSRMDFSGGPNYSFAYDALHRMTNASGLRFDYDALNRVTNITDSGVSFGAAYGAGGRLTNVTYNSGAVSVTYHYDSRDRLVQVRDSLTSAQVDFQYDDAGRLTNVVRANGVNGGYEYDPVGRITRIREGDFLDLQYTIDDAGEVTSLDATAPLSPSPAGANANNFSFNTAHEINSPGYTYDSRGRLTASPGHTFAWNAASQLVRVDSVTNAYNGAGNLISRSSSSGRTRYFYHHAIGLTALVAEQDADTSQFIRYYVWTPGGRLLYLIDAANGNAVSYYHFDRVGSTLAMTSAAGTVTDAYAYTPYGVLMAHTGASPQPFTYVGEFGVRYEPAAGLYQMRSRYYDPQTARFLSRDPVWPRPSDPLSLNPYSYAANDPLAYIDPSGAGQEQVYLDARYVQLELSTKLKLAVRYDLDSLGGAPLAVDSGSELLSGTPNLRPLLDLSGGRREMRISGLNSLDRRFRPQDYFKPFQVNGSSGSGARRLSLYGVNNYRSYSSYYCGLPQPFSRVSPTLQFNLSSEMFMVNLYGAALNVQKHVNPLGVHSAGALFVSAFTGVHPDDLEPKGLAFVNGQQVEPKIGDIIASLYWYDDFYDSLNCDYYPGEVNYTLFRNWMRMGGSAGLFLNSGREILRY